MRGRAIALKTELVVVDHQPQMRVRFPGHEISLPRRAAHAPLRARGRCRLWRERMPVGNV